MDDEPIIKDDHLLLRNLCKSDGTQSDNGEGKYEKWVAEDTAERYFDTETKDNPNLKEYKNKKQLLMS